MIRLKIPLSAPDVSLAEVAAVAEVLRSSRLSLGPKLALGDAGVFAFYPNKQITAGEGGMIVTRDSVIAKKIRAPRNQGRYEMKPMTGSSTVTSVSATASPKCIAL